MLIILFALVLIPSVKGVCTCRFGGQLVGNSCQVEMYLVDSYHAALKACQKINGSLPILHNHKDTLSLQKSVNQTFLSPKTSHDNAKIWLGIYYGKWADGSNYTEFKEDYTPTQLAFDRYSGEWLDYNESAIAFCLYKPDSSCTYFKNLGWTYFNFSSLCHAYAGDSLNWYDASSFCYDYVYYLHRSPTIRSYKENELLYSFVRSKTKTAENVWLSYIGGIRTKNCTMWQNDEPMKYFNFEDATQAQYCQQNSYALAMKLKTKNPGKWAFYDASMMKGFTTFCTSRNIELINLTPYSKK